MRSYDRWLAREWAKMRAELEPVEYIGMPHFQVRGIIKRWFESKKPISEGAIFGLVKEGYANSAYGEIGRHIYHYLKAMKEDKHYYISDKVFTMLRRRLHNDPLGSNYLSHLWMQGPSGLQSKLYYPEFNQNFDETFEIRVVNSWDEAEENLKIFMESPSKTSIYMDTESAHFNLRNGLCSRLALITLCDYDAKIVVLWRVHKMGFYGIRDVRFKLSALSHKRTIAVFGDEEVLSPRDNYHIRHKDLQYRFDGVQLSLKNVVEDRLGMELDKSEQMSVWTAEKLSKDQERYAAMDAIVLHKISTWSNRRV